MSELPPLPVSFEARSKLKGAGSRTSSAVAVVAAGGGGGGGADAKHAVGMAYDAVPALPADVAQLAGAGALLEQQQRNTEESNAR